MSDQRIPYTIQNSATGETQERHFRKPSYKLVCPYCGGRNERYRESYQAHVAALARSYIAREATARDVTLCLDADAAAASDLSGEASVSVWFQKLWPRLRKRLIRADEEAKYLGSASAKLSDGRYHFHLVLFSVLPVWTLRKLFHGDPGLNVYVKSANGDETDERFAVRRSAYAWDNAKRGAERYIGNSERKGYQFVASHGMGYHSEPAKKRRLEAVKRRTASPSEPISEPVSESASKPNDDAASGREISREFSREAAREFSREANGEYASGDDSEDDSPDPSSVLIEHNGQSEEHDGQRCQSEEQNSPSTAPNHSKGGQSNPRGSPNDTASAASGREEPTAPPVKYGQHGRSVHVRSRSEAIKRVRSVLSRRMGDHVHVDGVGACRLLQIGVQKLEGCDLAATVHPPGSDTTVTVPWPKLRYEHPPMIRKSLLPQPTNHQDMSSQQRNRDQQKEDRGSEHEEEVERFMSAARYSTVTIEQPDGTQIRTRKDHETGEVEETVIPPEDQ